MAPVAQPGQGQRGIALQREPGLEHHALVRHARHGLPAGHRFALQPLPASLRPGDTRKVVAQLRR